MVSQMGRGYFTGRWHIKFAFMAAAAAFILLSSQFSAIADSTPDPPPPPGTKPPVHVGTGIVAGIPQTTGGLLFYCRDAWLDNYDWFAQLSGWFPSVIHTSYSVGPHHQVIDMAYASDGTMTFKNVVVPATGTYTVTFRYAYASGLFPGVIDRPEGISANGNVVTSLMHFPITHSFSVYSTSSIQVPLLAGVNVIQMFNVTDHGVSRIDTMLVK